MAEPSKLNRFRVMRRKQDSVMYIAMPDLLEYLRDEREKPPTRNDARVILLDKMIDQFSRMVYESLMQ